MTCDPKDIDATTTKQIRLRSNFTSRDRFRIADPVIMGEFFSKSDPNIRWGYSMGVVCLFGIGDRLLKSPHVDFRCMAF